MTEEFWKNIINGLDAPDLPEVSTQPIVEEEEDSLEKKEAAVLRLRLDIYLISPLVDESKAYIVNAGQRLEDLGVMTVGEALTIIKSRKKKS